MTEQQTGLRPVHPGLPPLYGALQSRMRDGDNSPTLKSEPILSLQCWGMGVSPMHMRKHGRSSGIAGRYPLPGGNEAAGHGSAVTRSPGLKHESLDLHLVRWLCPVMDHRTLSPKKAASRAGCGRSSVMRALSSGHLRAIRDNNGNWQIEPEAVDDWMSMRRSHDRQSPDISDGPHPVTPLDTPETLAKLAAAETRAELLSAQVQDLKADRDAWRSQAERLASETQTVQRSGWLDRLLGR